MEYRFAFSRSVHARNLRFPVPMHWCLAAGAGELLIEGVPSRDACSEWHIPAEHAFDVALSPGIEGVAAGHVMLEGRVPQCEAAPDWCALQYVFAARERSFGQALAQAVFEAPEFAWQLDDTARRIGISSRALQMRLFREAYAFSSTVRRCRLLHLWLQAMFAQPAADAGSHVARANAASLEASFSTHLHSIARSKLPARPHSNTDPHATR